MAEQIFADGPLDAPAKYVVPGSSEIIPVAVQAVLDGTGASGDFVPTLIFRSQAGHVIARVPTSTTVAAGGSAEVSWFPNVGAAGGAATVLTSGLLWGNVSGLTLTSGVVTEVVLDTWTSAPGSQPPLTFVEGATLNTIALKEYRVFLELKIVWPAANYDRYIEFSPAGATFSTGEMVIRNRGSLSPDADIQVISGVLTGNPATPVALNMRARQASGVNRTVSGSFAAYGWPRIKGALYG